MKVRVKFIISPEGKYSYCVRQGKRTIVYPVRVEVNKPGIFAQLPSKLCGDCLPDIIREIRQEVGKKSVTVIDHRSAANN